MSAFALACIVGYVGTVSLLARMRGAFAARVGAFVLLLEGALALGAWTIAGPARPLVWIAQAQVLLYVLGTATGRMSRPAWLALVSWPALGFISGAFLALPWMVLGTTRGAWVPFAAAAAGFGWSLRARRETVTIDLTPPDDAPLRRATRAVQRRPGLSGPGSTGLRIVQITDPHLGPFMSEERLRAICERAVAADPDLVFLTGDFFTFEAQGTPGVLGRALAPLRAHPHVYACRGNHDLETPAIVLAGLAEAGVRLLVDEAVTVRTRVGAVQIVGLDFRWRDRGRAMRSVLVDLARPRDGLRIVLLHDPGAFRLLPRATADLVLSGHTHGGHVGLLALGLPWTAVGLVARMPDHGPWTANGNLLYVHRGNGHYGFPLRVGVPAEESVLELVKPRTPALSTSAGNNPRFATPRPIR